MTVQRPGSVQAQAQGHASRSDLARRGKCCCCCSLRSGVITLSILLLIKGVILSAQWYWFSENYASYYNYSDDSSDSNDQMSMGMGMHSSSKNNDDNVPVSSSSDDELASSEGGSGMSHEGNQQQGGEQGGGQQQAPQEGSQGSQEGGQQGGQDGKGQVMETQAMEQDEEEMGYESDESDEYVEVDFEIPTWVSALVWACVAWHFIGGLFGTFGACSYSKCCSFSFYVWWLLTITVAFAIGVLYFIYGSFHWCMFIAFSIAMIIGSYFTCKSKKWYNVLRDDIPAPQGYAGIEYENSV